SGAQRYVPVTVRSASTAGKVVIKNGAATWQAYNMWGGYDLYNGPGGEADYDNRSLAVSLDRPFDKNGAPLFLVYERGAIQLAARVRDQHGHRSRPAPAGRGERARLTRARRVLVTAGARVCDRRPRRRGQPGVPRRYRDVPA